MKIIDQSLTLKTILGVFFSALNDCWAHKKLLFTLLKQKYMRKNVKSVRDKVSNLF